MNVRLDKWLWMVRLFRTRTLATEACKSGHVHANKKRLKPSSSVQVEQILEVQKAGITRRIKVLGSPGSRLSAKKVAEYMEDLTPDEEWEKLKQSPYTRLKGSGRPTKKERRSMEAFERSLI